jgi:hypothetical protein
MGKFCPHATALRKLPWGSMYIANSCAIVGEWGDELNQQNGQGSAPHLPKIVFLFLGFVLESAGMSSKK